MIEVMIDEERRHNLFELAFEHLPCLPTSLQLLAELSPLSLVFRIGLEFSPIFLLYGFPLMQVLIDLFAIG